MIGVGLGNMRDAERRPLRARRVGAAEVSARPLTWHAPDQGLRLVDSRGEASHNATMQQASSLATQRLPVIASGF